MKEHHGFVGIGGLLRTTDQSSDDRQDLPLLQVQLHLGSVCRLQYGNIRSGRKKIRYKVLHTADRYCHEYQRVFSCDVSADETPD